MAENPIPISYLVTMAELIVKGDRKKKNSFFKNSVLPELKFLKSKEKVFYIDLAVKQRLIVWNNYNLRFKRSLRVFEYYKKRNHSIFAKRVLKDQKKKVVDDAIVYVNNLLKDLNNTSDQEEIDKDVEKIVGK